MFCNVLHSEYFLFLWTLHEAPCHLFDYVVKEFVFNDHIDDVTRNAVSYFLLFGRQYSRYQMLKNAAHFHNILNILNKSQPMMQFGPQISLCHFSQSLTFARYLSHLLTLMETTARVIVKTLASNMEGFTPVINLRLFYCSVTIRFPQHG